MMGHILIWVSCGQKRVNMFGIFLYPSCVHKNLQKTKIYVENHHEINYSAKKSSNLNQLDIKIGLA